MCRDIEDCKRCGISLECESCGQVACRQDAKDWMESGEKTYCEDCATGRELPVRLIADIEDTLSEIEVKMGEISGHIALLTKLIMKKTQR
jgi:hypothetical protein